MLLLLLLLQVQRWPGDAWIFAEEAASQRGSYFRVSLPTDICKIKLLQPIDKLAHVKELNKLLPKVRC